MLAHFCHLTMPSPRDAGTCRGGPCYRGRTGLKPTQTLATLTLLDDGNTVPFIARYRKEATGNLDEVQIQADRRPR